MIITITPDMIDSAKELFFIFATIFVIITFTVSLIQNICKALVKSSGLDDDGFDIPLYKIMWYTLKYEIALFILISFVGILHKLLGIH